MTKQIKADDIALIPFRGFSKAAKQVLSISKKDSDLKLAAFQAANVKKRAAKKKR
jgi:hypothetical protein